MTKHLFTAAIGVFMGWYMAYDLSVYGTDDIYYVKGTHLGTESGRIDSTFTSMKAMSTFLDSISAEHSNEFFRWNRKVIMECTQVTFVGNEVVVSVPDPSGDSLIVLRRKVK